MKLEYLLATTKDGINIYSSCFGAFCANLSFDKRLMSGFLSALSTIPDALGQEDSLQSVEMGYTKLLFNHTHPSGHIICIGVIKDTIEEPKTTEMATLLFKRVEDLLEKKYAGKEWAIFGADEYKEFDETMVHDIIEPTLSVFTDNDICDHNHCPFEHDPHDDFYLNNREIPKWELMKHRYREAFEEMPFFVKVLMPMFLPIYKFFDKRRYHKKASSI